MPNGNRSTNKRNNIPDTKKNTTGSIAHAINVLICLSNDINAVTDIARQCNLGKSTVHRVLKLLKEARLVIQDSTDRSYYLGPLIMQLASNPVTTHEYLTMYAVEEIKHLSNISEETVTLDILIGTQLYSLYEIPSKHDLVVTQESRMAGPIHAGASAKVLLSQLNDKKLKIALGSTPLIQTTERTVTSKELLIAQIKEIRQQGYAISYGERIPGAMCISASIKHYSLPVALSIVGPESRLQPKAEGIVAELKASVDRISSNIASIFGKRRQVMKR